MASRVDAVASGKEAHRRRPAARRRPTPYDIVFMDWRMPGMDGLQASRHIKSDETLTHQPRHRHGDRVRPRRSARGSRAAAARRLPRQAGHQVDDRGHAGERVRATTGEDAAAAAEGEQAARLRGRAHPAGRGQRDQPADRGRAARRRGRDGDGRQQRTRGGGDAVERPAAAAVRRGADGPADAGDGRLPGDARSSAPTRASRRCRSSP